MKVIVNKFIPFHGFIAMMFYNIVLWRKEYEWMMHTYKFKAIINHESIHLAQMKDFCKWVPLGGTIFYLVYLLEWVYRLFFTKDFLSQNAYMNLSFEKEARKYAENDNYLNERKQFAQWK